MGSWWARLWGEPENVIEPVILLRNSLRYRLIGEDADTEAATPPEQRIEFLMTTDGENITVKATGERPVTWSGTVAALCGSIDIGDYMVTHLEEPAIIGPVDPKETETLSRNELQEMVYQMQSGVKQAIKAVDPDKCLACRLETTRNNRTAHLSKTVVGTATRWACGINGVETMHTATSEPDIIRAGYHRVVSEFIAIRDG